MRWRVSGATNAIIDHGIGSISLTGSLDVSPKETTKYTLVANDKEGRGVEATVTVSVEKQDPMIPEGFKNQPSYTGDCRNRPEGSVCIGYDDGYIWLVYDAIRGGKEGGIWRGKRIDVAEERKAEKIVSTG